MKEIPISVFALVCSLLAAWFLGLFVGERVSKYMQQPHQCKQDTVFVTGVVMTKEQLELFNKEDFKSYIKDTAYHRWISDHKIRNQFKNHE